MSDNVEVVSVHSENWKEFYVELKEFCTAADQDSSIAARNLEWTNWEENPGSLMHTLVIQKRYDPPGGMFDLVMVNGEPVACSGCYLSDWSDRVLVMGVRTWTKPNARNTWWHGDLLLPRQIELAKELDCAAAVMSFNEYNDWLEKFLKRIASGKAVTLGYKHPDFYKDFVFLDGFYKIKHTKQTVAAKLLTCTLEEFKNKYSPPEYEHVSSMG